MKLITSVIHLAVARRNETLDPFIKALSDCPLQTRDQYQRRFSCETRERGWWEYKWETFNRLNCRFDAQVVHMTELIWYSSELGIILRSGRVQKYMNWWFRFLFVCFCISCEISNVVVFSVLAGFSVSHLQPCSSFLGWIFRNVIDACFALCPVGEGGLCYCLTASTQRRPIRIFCFSFQITYSIKKKNSHSVQLSCMHAEIGLGLWHSSECRWCWVIMSSPKQR